MAATVTRGARASAIRRVNASAYSVPTATDQESDGTLVWDSTEVVVVEVTAGDCTGLGYTYCHRTAADLIESKLAKILDGADPFAPQRSWAQMQVQARQVGHAGIAAMAISAVDIALWDLKARLLGVCLADVLPRFHLRVPIYGSGGFTNYTPEQLREQVSGWVREGIARVKIKVGREKAQDLERLAVAREAAGEDVELMVDGNGAYQLPEALLWAERFGDRGVHYFEEPLSSQDLEGLGRLRRRAPAGVSIAAGEYGWNLPYFHRMLDAGAVDILQADVTRCGGITNMLRIDGLCRARGLPFSAHCAPAISVHACCGMETAIHIEYFYDHYRIEGMLFNGTPQPRGGALEPDRGALGHGLVLDHERAAPHRVAGEAGAAAARDGAQR
jgi:L-alanine-DL-glutamate epimerase-like enolase superfamily enzyme